MGKFVKLVVISVFAFSSVTLLKSQDLSGTKSSAAKLKLNISSDFVSRYVWRGSDFDNSPAVQPTLSLSGSHLEIGAWGSVAVSNSFREVDLFAKYTIKSVTLILTDYYIPKCNGVPTSPDSRYFMYADKKTAHFIEASVLYKAAGNFPVWLLGGVFLYGNDKRWGYDATRDSLANSYYSTYIEAGYTFNIQKNSVDVFAGVTPWAGAYGKSAGLVNIGLTGSRKIKISDDFEIPVKASLIFNPLASQAFLVFGFTI